MSRFNIRKLTSSRISSFRRKVFRFYKASGRHDLPFRKTTDPYKIAVSEIMLQQTQVSRVLPKYDAWLKRWPTWKGLAKAEPSAVLTAWSGLGYNRRALYLRMMAIAINDQFAGKFPSEPGTLKTLPGIGPYTANAILIFAYNLDIVTIDTNIRRVLIHELQLPSDISKADLETVALRCLPKGKSRDWHNALMDYSAVKLPRRIPGIPSLSKQGKFDGSDRQMRGAIVRTLTVTSTITRAQLLKQIGGDSNTLSRILQGLQKEGLIKIQGNQVRLP